MPQVTPIRDANYIPALTDEDAPRFWERVECGGDGDCWLWTGAVTHNGYGFFFMRRPHAKHFRAHRITWTAAHGQIPAGFDLDHAVCQNPRCVNPAHLEVVTTEVNTWRRDGRHWRELVSPMIFRVVAATGDIDADTFSVPVVARLLEMSNYRIAEACRTGELSAGMGKGASSKYRRKDQWYIRREALIDMIVNRAAEDAGLSAYIALKGRKAA